MRLLRKYYVGQRIEYYVYDGEFTGQCFSNFYVSANKESQFVKHEAEIIEVSALSEQYKQPIFLLHFYHLGHYCNITA